MRRIMLLVLVIVSLSGCMMKSVPYQAAQQQDGKAVVYVYRPHSFVNSAETMDLFINGKEIDTLANNGYRFAYVEPGSVHVLLKEWVFPFNTYGEETFTGITAGQVYYVKADPVPLGGFDLILVHESVGSKEIASSVLYVEE